MPEETNIVLSVENVEKKFVSGSRLFRNFREVNALDCISFSMTKGESLGVIGESGSGKSTLAQILMGMLTFDRGQIQFEGKPLNYWHRSARKKFLRKVQMVFQDPVSSFNPKRKIGPQLEDSLRCLTNFNAAERQDRIHLCLEKTRMEKDSLNFYPQQFSGGQAQRLAIARSLLSEPTLLILDEAVSALDVSVQATILNLLKDLHRDMNLSILFIGHDLAVVEYLCPRLFIMKNGKIMEDDRREVIFDSPKNEYTKTLVEAVYSV